MFPTYLRLGYEHLLDLQGADHILFIVVLCAGYALARWRELLVLITAFTVGHSLSLALATVGAVRADSSWVEFLIPVTIAATALLNFWEPGGEERRVAQGTAAPGAAPPAGLEEGASPGGSVPGETPRATRVKYVLAVVFGLIHGLGFSGFLRLLLGDEGSLLVPLLAFNIGLELAQIVVALATLAAAALLVRGSRIPHTWWTRGVSAAVGVAAVVMAAGRWPL